MDLASRGWTTASSDEDNPDAAYYSFYYYKNNDAEADQTAVYPADERFINTVVNEDGSVTRYWKNERDTQGNRIVVHPVEDKDGVNGAEAILQKVQIIREWFRTAWGIELDELRKMVYDIQ